MSENKMKPGKLGQSAIDAYQKIENAVVGTYQKIEDTVVGEYKRVESVFVNAFLSEDKPGQEEPAQESGEPNALK